MSGAGKKLIIKFRRFVRIIRNLGDCTTALKCLHHKTSILVGFELRLTAHSAGCISYV
jgi:hypothetical protein